MDILKLAQENYDYAVKIRRHLHENPELTSFEFNTLELIKTELTNMGIEWVEVPDGGIVGIIHGGKPGKMVLMRADMDA
ncbi:MAG: amidohydrolase, partial [Lachnospiraceae bacterium]|nr:amidohydrolase [Lachnospiraceae bacterium]